MAKLKSEYKTDVQPASLENLEKFRGKKLGARTRITKRFVEASTDYLCDNRQYFEEQMMLLKPKEYCEMYLKMAKLVTPTKIESTVEKREISWTLQPASTVELQKPVELAEYEENNDDD